MIHVKKILYATDFSSFSTQAYFYAVTLAETHQAELIIVHVHTPTNAFAVTPEMAPIIVEEPPEVRAFWKEQLAQIRPLNPNIPVEHVMLEGEPAEEILHCAADKGVDVIVMGTHGRSGLSRLVMGSVAEKVLHKAECSVLVVKMPKAHHAAA